MRFLFPALVVFTLLLSDTDTRTFTGVGLGPASYQDRIRLVLVAEVDPTGRIKLPKQKRGAGW